MLVHAAERDGREMVMMMMMMVVGVMVVGMWKSLCRCYRRDARTAYGKVLSRGRDRLCARTAFELRRRVARGVRRCRYRRARTATVRRRRRVRTALRRLQRVRRGCL